MMKVSFQRRAIENPGLRYNSTQQQTDARMPTNRENTTGPKLNRAWPIPSESHLEGIGVAWKHRTFNR